MTNADLYVIRVVLFLFNIPRDITFNKDRSEAGLNKRTVRQTMDLFVYLDMHFTYGGGGNLL